MSVAKEPAKKLPEGFIDRLKEIIPEADDPHLYQMLAGDEPYSLDVRVFFEGQIRYLADKLGNIQKAKLDALFAEWRSGYVSPPTVATVKLYSASED